MLPAGQGLFRASSRPPDWLKSKNPAREAVRRDAEEDWGRSR